MTFAAWIRAGVKNKRWGRTIHDILSPDVVNMHRIWPIADLAYDIYYDKDFPQTHDYLTICRYIGGSCQCAITHKELCGFKTADDLLSAFKNHQALHERRLANLLNDPFYKCGGLSFCFEFSWRLYRLENTTWFFKKRIKRRLPSKDAPIACKKRYEILRKYNFKCCACGRGPNETKLQIDHKLPRSKGGTNHTHNLWVLCFECNIGKGNRHDDTDQVAV